MFMKTLKVVFLLTFLVTASVTTISCRNTKQNTSDLSKISIIANNYVSKHKQWPANQYHLDNIGGNSDGHTYKIDVIHNEDQVPSLNAGGGKSMQLIIDMEKGKVISELYFQ
jgi:hypothetical protein